MGDMDACECVFNHETAMRRLLSLLRNSQQGFCTDSECTNEMPGPESDGIGGFSNMFMMMTMWMVMALALFFLRPKSLRSEPPEKPNGSGGGGSSNNDEDGPSTSRAGLDDADDQPGPSNRT